MNDSIQDKLKEIVNLQDIIKTEDLSYKAKIKEVYNFNKYSLPTVFLGDIYIKDIYNQNILMRIKQYCS